MFESKEELTKIYVNACTSMLRKIKSENFGYTPFGLVNIKYIKFLVNQGVIIAMEEQGFYKFTSFGLETWKAIKNNVIKLINKLYPAKDENMERQDAKMKLKVEDIIETTWAVSYTHLTLPTIYSV